MTIISKNNKENKLNKILNKQSSKDTLRFMTCGSVDDGKSTLIGRILNDTGSIYIDELKALDRSIVLNSVIVITPS